MIKRAALLLLLTGCSFFSRSKNNIYSIDPLPTANRQSPIAARQAAPIAIDALELPPGLDRREVVVRQADHRLDVRSTELWAASLEPLVLHVLASDLASRLPVGMVVLPGATRPPGVRAISIVFDDLSAGPDAKVTLDARWTLAGVIHREQLAVATGSLDSAKVAAGMSEALAQLADRIAAAQLSQP